MPHRLEGGNLLVAVRVKVLLGVVDGHASVDAVGERRVLHDGHALVRAVGVLEEHDGGPVVGEVLGEGARRAAGLVRDVALHGRVEPVAAHDLVDVRRRRLARLHEGVQPLDADRAAAEAQRRLGWPSKGKEREPLHGVNRVGECGGLRSGCGSVRYQREETFTLPQFERRRWVWDTIYTALPAVVLFLSLPFPSATRRGDLPLRPPRATLI